MDSPVLILGAGTFGLSTAFHLVQAGYTDITVVDKAKSIPSEFSAGYDLNKIVRAEYPDSFYSELALDAINAWKTPFFSPYYRETGYLIANSENAPEKTRDTLRKFRASIASNPAFAESIFSVDTRADIRKFAPAFDGPAKGWKGYFNKLAGYARAADAMRAVFDHCVSRGVTFELGEAVTKLLYSPDGACIGAETASGRAYRSKITIMALGACAASVLPSIGQHQQALGVPVAHIQVTEEEAAKLKYPVTFCRDLGFLFEPDPETNLIKLCPANGGYLYFGEGSQMSLPPSRTEQYTFTPEDDEERLRQLLRDILPDLADRPFVQTRFCWFMDTKDHDYIIDFVPNTPGLIVVSGDSGHGYKMLPVIGSWVLKVLEEGLQVIPRWKWKGDEKRNEVSLRAFPTRDLEELSVRQLYRSEVPAH